MKHLLRFLPWRLAMAAPFLSTAYSEMALFLERHRAASGLGAVGMLLYGGFWFLQPPVASLAVFRSPFHEAVQLLSKQSQPAILGPPGLRITLALSAMLFMVAGLTIRTVQFLA